jgi:hypothetical protein
LEVSDDGFEIPGVEAGPDELIPESLSVKAEGKLLTG